MLSWCPYELGLRFVGSQLARSSRIVSEGDMIDSSCELIAPSRSLSNDTLILGMSE